MAQPQGGPLRFDLAVLSANLESRDGGVSKGARLLNAYTEKDRSEFMVWKRPGMSTGLLSTNTSWGQGLIPFGSNLISVKGGTAYGAFPTSTIALETSTEFTGYTATHGNFVYRFNPQNGHVYRAAVSTALSFVVLTTTGTLTAAAGWDFKEAHGYMFASPNAGGGAAFDVYRSTDGTSWASWGDTPAGGLAALGGTLYRFRQLGGFGSGGLFNISSLGGTWNSFGTITQCPPGTFAGNPALGTGGGSIWAFGTFASAVDGTRVVLARSNDMAGWTFVSTITGAEIPGNVFSRMDYNGSQVCAVVGTGSIGAIIGMNTAASWSTLGTFNLGVTISNWRSVIFGSSQVHMFAGTQWVAPLGYYGRLLVSGGGGSFAQDVPIGPVSPQATPLGLVRNAAGTKIVIQAADFSYTYDIASGVLTVITGTNFPTQSVPGMVYLDGTYYILDTAGTIWNSTPAADDPTTWPTDGFITAEFEPDSGVALAKALNYVVAFGQWSIELFWDAGNANGSPLLPLANGVILIGCAHANSIAQTESTLVFMAQRKGSGSTYHKGRFIAILIGTSYEELSTPDISRILDTDDLAGVYSSIVEVNGHTWYLLSLRTSNITLVYDFKEKKWFTWSKLKPGTAIPLTAVNQTNGQATIVFSAANGTGIADGDPVAITGVTPTDYNGTYNVNKPTSTSATYPVASTLGGTGTGGTMAATPWVESYFDSVAACGIGNVQLLQAADGLVYSISLANATDLASNPINFKIRTSNMDFGSNNNKFCHTVAVVGDILGTTGYSLLRYSDDDFQTYSSYRRFDISQVNARQNRWGAFRRRAWEYRYTGGSQYRAGALELNFTQGVS